MKIRRRKTYRTTYYAAADIRQCASGCVDEKRTTGRTDGRMRRKRDFRMPPHFVGIFSVSETAFHPNGRSGFGKNATQRVLRPLRVIFSCFSPNFRQTSPQISPNGGKMGERGRFSPSQAERG